MEMDGINRGPSSLLNIDGKPLSHISPNIDGAISGRIKKSKRNKN